MTTLYNRKRPNSLDDLIKDRATNNNWDRLPPDEILWNAVDWFEDEKPEVAAEAEAILECWKTGYYSLEEQMDEVEAFVTKHGFTVI